MLFLALLDLKPVAKPRESGKGAKEEEHAKQPSDRLPRISPSQFPVVRRGSPAQMTMAMNDKPSNRVLGVRSRDFPRANFIALMSF